MVENRTFLINKKSIYSVIKTGNLPERTDKNEESKNKLYISASESKDKENLDSLETTSPLGNISVFRVVNTLNNWTSYSADDVKHYVDMQKNGEMPEGVRVEKQTSEQFFEEQFKNQEISFRRAIQARDNSCLGIVISYINRAMDENNQELLGMMEELIKHNPNFEFLFRDGKLSRQVVNSFREQSNSDMEYMMDSGEQLEEETGGKFDASKASFKELDRIADTSIDELIRESSEEIIVDEQQIDENVKESEQQQKLEAKASEKKKNILGRVARMTATVNLIRNAVARRRAQRAIEEGQKKSEQALDNKVRNGFSRVSGLRRGNENRDTEDKDNTPKQSEDRVREESTELEQRQLKELEQAKKRETAGKKLTPYQEELLARAREASIKIADERMKQGRTIDNYTIKNKEIIENTVSVGIAAGRIGEKTNEEPHKDDEGR